MQSGLIRRVDDLGRIVIPKQVRRQLGVEKGGLLEFAVKNDFIVMRKFSPLNKLQSKVSVLLNTLAKSEGANAALITPFEVLYAVNPLENDIASNLNRYAKGEKVFETKENANVFALPLKEKEDLGSLLLVGENIKENEKIRFAAQLLLALFVS